MGQALRCSVSSVEEAPVEDSQGTGKKLWY